MFDAILSILKTEWPVITGAPVLVITLVAVAASLGALSAWWLRGTTTGGRIQGLEGQIAGLNQQIATIQQQLETRDERLKLAAEKFERVEEEKTRLAGNLQELKKQIAAKASLFVLEGTSGSAEANVYALTGLLNDLKTTIAPASAVTYLISPKSDERKG